MRWCPQWWAHAEALSRLEALWRTWEAARLDPLQGIAVWYRDFCDPQLLVLFSPAGPFAQCTAERHSPGGGGCRPCPHRTATGTMTSRTGSRCPTTPPAGRRRREPTRPAAARNTPSRPEDRGQEKVMSEQPHEDPLAHASTKITAYVSVAARAAERSRRSPRPGPGSGPRPTSAPRRRCGRSASPPTARPASAGRRCWTRGCAGRPRSPTPRRCGAGAGLAAGPRSRAGGRPGEDRLRRLRPDAMEHYDWLRDHGVEPVQAMRQAAPFFDRPPARPGEPGPDRRH